MISRIVETALYLAAWQALSKTNPWDHRRIRMLCAAIDAYEDLA